MQRKPRALPRLGPRHRRILPVLLALALSAVPLSAQVVTSNPSLPAEESFVYVERIQQQSLTVNQGMSRQTDGGDSWYEFSSKSAESEVTMRLDSQTLFARSSVVITRSGDSVIRRTTEIIQANPTPRAGELVIGDYASLPVTLRGLPWGTFSSAHLVTLGAPRGGQVTVLLTVVGRESISTGGRTWNCWKVELGLGGLMGAFFSKSTYWYAVEAPHVMVKSEVPTGGPGSPLRVTELQSYSARER